MKTKDEFIMLPTVDFCFKKLMENPKVRQGFVAALLKVEPRFVQETELLPTSTDNDFPEDKLGILDVRIRLVDGTQMDLEMQVRYFEYWDERAMFYLSKMFTGQMKKGDDYDALKKCIHVSILDFIHFPEDEDCYRTIHLRDDKTGKLYSDKLELQILELKKLPKLLLGELPEMRPEASAETFLEMSSGDHVIAWMKFFSGKNREEFESMAKTNEYIDEAYDTLLKLSADDIERLEYEAREKAIRDYNSQMNSARRQGLREGEEIGLRRGEEIGLQKGEEIGLQRGEEIGLQKGLQQGEERLRGVIVNLLKKELTDAEICEIAECTQELIDEVRKVL